MDDDLWRMTDTRHTDTKYMEKSARACVKESERETGRMRESEREREGGRERAIVIE